MSDLVVITFEAQDEAGRVRKVLRQQQSKGLIKLDDSAVVEKDPSGKIQVKNELDHGVKVGTIGGGMLGLLIGSIFFPFAGLLMGAAGGALVGASLDLGVDRKFVKQVGDSLHPGSSALFVIVRDADPTAALASLKPYKGTVYHTSLSPDGEESLRRVLKERHQS